MSAILITLPCTALEAESKAMNDPKTQRAQSSRGKSAAPQNSGKGGGENDATNGRDIDGDSRWGTLNPARACRLLRRYIFESTCLSLCFRGGAMIVRKIETCPECGREHDLRRRRETHKREKRGGACTGYCKTTKRVEALALDSLTSAKRKPAGCSAVRWRIELSRRRLAAVGLLDMLPDPDMLA